MQMKQAHNYANQRQMNGDQNIMSSYKPLSQDTSTQHSFPQNTLINTNNMIGNNNFNQQNINHHSVQYQQQHHNNNKLFNTADVNLHQNMQTQQFINSDALQKRGDFQKQQQNQNNFNFQQSQQNSNVNTNQNQSNYNMPLHHQQQQQNGHQQHHMNNPNKQQQQQQVIGSNNNHNQGFSNDNSQQMMLSPMNFGDPPVIIQPTNITNSTILQQPQQFQRQNSNVNTFAMNGGTQNNQNPISGQQTAMVKNKQQIDPNISNPSVGQSLRNLLNYLIAEFNSKVLEFTKLSETQREKFHALASSHQFNNQYNQSKTQADLYRQYVVGYDGIGQYDRIKQMKKFITNAKYLIENIQIALQSSQIEETYNKLDVKYQQFLRHLNIKTFELLGKEEVFAIERKAFIVRQLEQTQDPEFDLKSAIRILTHKFERSFRLNAIVNFSNQNPKNKNLVELIKTLYLGQNNYLLRQVEEDLIQSKVLNVLKTKISENQEDFLDFSQGTGIKIHRVEEKDSVLRLISDNLMTFMVRLEYVFQDKEFIILLADFSFDALGDSLITEQLTKMKSYNRAIVQRQEQKRKMIALINDKVFQERQNTQISHMKIILQKLSDIFRALAFKKFQHDLQKNKNVRSMQLIKATSRSNEIIRFYYLLSQNEKPLSLDIINLQQHAQEQQKTLMISEENEEKSQIQSSISETEKELFIIKYNHPLPLLNKDDIVKMSKSICIYGDGSSSFDILQHLETINKRFKYLQLIEYYESFKDEISLTYPYIDLSIDGESQTITLRLFKATQIISFQIDKSQGFIISYASHLNLDQQAVFNEMLKVTDPKKFTQINYLFQILVPHAFFAQVECQMRSQGNIHYLYHCIDDFVDIRRGQIINQANTGDIERYQTSPVFQSWMMKTLQKQFGFNLNQLAQAHQHLYSNQMVLVINLKPIVGEVEMKLDKRPRNIIYMKLSIDQYERRLQYMSDLNLSVEHTQILQHITSNAPLFSMRLDHVFQNYQNMINVNFKSNMCYVNGDQMQDSQDFNQNVYQDNQQIPQSAQYNANRKGSSFQGGQRLDGNQSNLSDVQDMDAYGRFQSQSLMNQQQNYQQQPRDQSYYAELDINFIVDVIMKEDLLDSLLEPPQDPTNPDQQNIMHHDQQNPAVFNINQYDIAISQSQQQYQTRTKASLSQADTQHHPQQQNNMFNIDETLEQMKRQSMARQQLYEQQHQQSTLTHKNSNINNMDDSMVYSQQQMQQQQQHYQQVPEFEVGAVPADIDNNHDLLQDQDLEMDQS